MDFEVLVDDSLMDLGTGTEISPIQNKRLLSIINDFEDAKWRYEKFNNFVWDNIAETALSHSEREALQAQPASLLKNAAKKLRLSDSNNDIGRGSELAEIVLYGIMKHHYGALPVVPKIFYKQNVQDNAKGADSVHILLEPEGRFSLWFGEAKFYNSIEDSRLDSVVQSVKEALNTEKLKKENSIILNVSDLDAIPIDDALREAIKVALASKNSIDEIKPLINVPILLLHECNLTAGATENTVAYAASIRELHKARAISYFSKQVSALREMHKYGDIRFHLILFPVPKKEPIVTAFVAGVEYFKK